MVFNSLSFIFFFIIVSYFYYFPFKEKTKVQNLLILLSSYFFYGYANWKLVPLLILTTTFFFILGLVISKTKKHRKSSFLTTVGVLAGIGLLFYFKYFNFFIDSFSALLNRIGLHSNIGTFNIILPIGISFFTFKLISYVIEVHRGNMGATKDFVAFSTFIAFFPTILSGPIDRPNSFIPQLLKKRSFNYSLAVDGCRQILWGLFQKIVIADNLAEFTNNIWKDFTNQGSSVLIITAILYSIQIYTDFSGYSHIAIGVGKTLGFRVTKNFNYPFFSRNIAEYWRNWHISLTSWLTDYVFMPVNIKFRNLGKIGVIFAILITMLIIGMWHGAKFTFVIFGIYHGLLYIPLVLMGSILNKRKLNTNKYGLPSLLDLSKMVLTFVFVTIGLILFRAENIPEALEYFARIGKISLNTLLVFGDSGLKKIIPVIVFTVLFFIIEWIGRKEEYAFSEFGFKWKRPVRIAFYYAILFSIYWFGGKEQQFIYFQF